MQPKPWHARPLPLLLGLVAYLLLVPAAAGDNPLPVLGLVTLLLFALGTLAVAQKPRLRAASLALLLASAAARVAFWIAPSKLPLLAMQVTGIGFLLLTTIALMRLALGSGHDIGERIEAALATYLLLGFLWAVAYSILDVVWPGAFRFPEGELAKGDATALARHSETAFLYFSFVTLTTMGYGDVTPVMPLARSVAVLEAVTGQLFLAVTIARLVGMRASEGRA